MTIHIGPLVFDHADHDTEGDILYLHIGAPPAPRAAPVTGGRAVKSGGRGL